MNRGPSGFSFHFSKYFQLVLLFCCLPIITCPSKTWSEDKASLIVNQINIEQHPEIVLYITATDENGKLISGLEKKYLSIHEDGNPVEIREVFPLGEGKEPLLVVLAIDRSGSMKGRPIEDAKKAALSFIGQIRPIDQVGIVAFDDQVSVVCDLTSDQNLLKDKILQLQVGKDTALNDALIKSLDLLSERTGRRAIVVLTDGKENRSKTTREGVWLKSAQKGIPITTVGLGTKIDQTGLKEISGRSGGQSFLAAQSAQLSELYLLIARLLINQYKITMISPRTLDGGWHQLEIQGSINQLKFNAQKPYLATLGPVLDPKVVRQLAYQENLKKGMITGMIIAIPILMLLIAIIIVRRRKGLAPGLRREKIKKRTD